MLTETSAAGRQGRLRRRSCDAVFPERRGWFLEYYEESKSWVPAGFRSWGEYEDKAAALRAWSPGVVHGLLQTEGYARALLETAPGATGEMVTTRLKARMERQRRVVMRDDPPTMWFVVDELSLYRCVGSPAVMAGQLRHLADVARRPDVTLQVLPGIRVPSADREAGRDMDWRKSTYSNANGGDCVETASEHGAVLVRDTADRDGGTLAFAADAWAAFTSSLS